MAAAHQETPARQLAELDASGCLVLGSSPVGWAHGGEDTTAAAMLAATDLSDMSDELALAGASWPAACDCARERGHLLRALRLTPDARVLEVGAGCGGVTRFIAEHVGLVDALEPTTRRAALAARRVADIDSAQVIIGDADMLPEGRAYDVIVLVGVLEYIGGWQDIEARVRFLQRLAARLRPGGHLVCAIENRFGVAYFAGQAEDHSGMLFQGVEDTRSPEGARTFGRLELEGIFHNAGLQAETFGVFPDYRFPRLVFSQALLDSDAQPLAWRVPDFPTPRHGSHAQTFILDERRVWSGLVRNGLGMDFANSFLVIATREGTQSLWPRDQLAAFYTTGRRRTYSTESIVRATSGGIIIDRRRLGSDTPDGSPLIQRGEVTPYHNGQELTQILADADDTDLRTWMGRFRELIESTVSASTGPVSFDIRPANVIVTDSALVPIDREFTHPDMDVYEVVWRGMTIAALELATITPTRRWNGRTVRDLVIELARSAGVSGDPPFDRIVQRQAELMADIFGGPRNSEAWKTRYDSELAGLWGYLDSELAGTIELRRDAGPQMRHRLDEAERVLGDARSRLATAEANVDMLNARNGETIEQLKHSQTALHEALTALNEERAKTIAVAAELGVVYDSTSWRLTAPLRALRRRDDG